MMKLKIKGIEFDIESATISGQINDPYWIKKYNPSESLALNWMLEVNCKPKEVKENSWKPYVYHQSLELKINTWKEIQNQTIQWDDSLNEIGEDSGFYVFEHGEIAKGEIKIGKLENNLFDIQWNGLCNIYFDDEYDEDIPFELICKASIGNIRVNGSEHDEVEDIESRLKKFISLDHLERTAFEVSEHEYESGVKMTSAIYNTTDKNDNR